MELLHTESQIGLVKILGRRSWRDRIGDFARSSSVVVVAGRIGPLRPCGEDCVSVSRVFQQSEYGVLGARELISRW